MTTPMGKEDDSWKPATEYTGPYQPNLKDLGAAGRAIDDVRSKLQTGGPEVNLPALYAYVTGVLLEDERSTVEQYIGTYRSWFDEYMSILQAVDVSKGEQDRK